MYGGDLPDMYAPALAMLYITCTTTSSASKAPRPYLMLTSNTVSNYKKLFNVQMHIQTV